MKYRRSLAHFKKATLVRFGSIAAYGDRLLLGRFLPASGQKQLTQRLATGWFSPTIFPSDSKKTQPYITAMTFTTKKDCSHVIAVPSL